MPSRMTRYDSDGAVNLLLAYTEMDAQKLFDAMKLDRRLWCARSLQSSLMGRRFEHIVVFPFSSSFSPEYKNSKTMMDSIERAIQQVRCRLGPGGTFVVIS